MNKKYIIPLFSFIALLFCFYIFIFPHLHFNSNATITATQRNQLKNLGANAAIKNEVPVASLLIYKNQIIATGKNSVVSDTNIAAHAEINAINNALKNMGFDAFKKLNRDSLFLITTFEPCPMCCGALSENNIAQVIVVQQKSSGYKFREWKRGYTLQKQMQFIKDDNLQDSLFKIVPGVNIKNISY